MTSVTGTFFVERKQPPLAPDEQEIVVKFHALYYRRWFQRTADTLNLSWFGHRALKCPLDLWMYQELLVRHRPDVVVETGTHSGGSALFMAMIFDYLGSGHVLSLDIDDSLERPAHPRITYIKGSSVDPAIMTEVKKQVLGRSAMVILDSNHRANHVFAEMNAYRSLVPVGGYLIVEDTNINGHPALPEFGPGPMEAVERFLADNDEFVVDPSCERFLMTCNPRGYLQRVKPAPPDGQAKELADAGAE